MFSHNNFILENIADLLSVGAPSMHCSVNSLSSYCYKQFFVDYLDFFLNNILVAQDSLQLVKNLLHISWQNGDSSPKNLNCHHFLSLVSFQTFFYKNILATLFNINKSESGLRLSGSKINIITITVIHMTCVIYSKSEFW